VVSRVDGGTDGPPAVGIDGAELDRVAGRRSLGSRGLAGRTWDEDCPDCLFGRACRHAVLTRIEDVARSPAGPACTVVIRDDDSGLWRLTDIKSCVAGP